MEGYRLFRKDMSERQGGGIALYVREQLECMELCLGMADELTESLWVRIKEQTSMGDTVMGICYRPPDQEEEVDEALYREHTYLMWRLATKTAFCLHHLRFPASSIIRLMWVYHKEEKISDPMKKQKKDNVPEKLQLRPEPAGWSRSGRLPAGAGTPRGKAFTPHGVTPFHPHPGHQPPALLDSSAQPAVLGGTAAPSLLRPTAGAPAQREHIPAGGKGRGARRKQPPVRTRGGTECEPGGVTSLGWGDGGMCPFVPGERQASLRLSISSTPDLMGIKIQEIKPPPQPSRTRLPPPPGCWKGDTHRLFLALPRPSPLKAAAIRRGTYLPRVAPGPPGRALSARLSAQASGPSPSFAPGGQLQLRPHSPALRRCQPAGPSRGGTGGSTLRGTRNC
ncbi:hypothetical protein QYF61_023503 [Mycteria americana]|uniref:Uncharacterized protein n=1 Tax=Mycteria americana TaxID=33587 RepID=A0AAN7SJC2_MYCAM|nr:hypothetical protein QYF61_023503 [Mycteria americana]